MTGTRTTLLLVCVAALPLPACMNTVNYHHSERFALATVETKATDPQLPLQGTVGVRVRTLLVTPGKGESNGDQAKSVISDFHLQRVPDSTWRLNPTIIRSAFITGKAARMASVETQAAISGFGSGEPGVGSAMREQLLRNVYQQLTASSDPVSLERKQDLDALEKLLPDANSLAAFIVYKPVAAGPRTNLERQTGLKLSDQGFDRVLEYEAAIRSSLANIEAVEDDRSYQLNGKVFTQAQMQQMALDKQDLLERKRLFVSRIGSSPAIDAALAHSLSQF